MALDLDSLDLDDTEVATHMDDDYELDFLDVPRRGGKPRTTGLTLVRDSGLGLTDVRDSVESYGEYLDYVKLRQFVIWYCNPASVRAKIEAFSAGGVVPFPGGTVYEAAYLRGEVPKTLEDLRQMGFGAIEISENVIDLSFDEKKDAIKRSLDLGFDVFFEHGPKYEEDPIDVKATAGEIKRLLAEGVHKVILERSQLDATIGPKGDWPTAGRIVELAEVAGAEHIVFEAETLDHQMWLISELGPDVNLGPNIDPYHVVAKLEPARVGIGRDEGYTFFTTMGATGSK